MSYYLRTVLSFSQNCLNIILSQSYFALPHCVKREMSYDHGTVLLLFQNCIIIISPQSPKWLISILSKSYFAYTQFFSAPEEN